MRNGLHSTGYLILYGNNYIRGLAAPNPDTGLNVSQPESEITNFLTSDMQMA